MKIIARKMFGVSEKLTNKNLLMSSFLVVLITFINLINAQQESEYLKREHTLIKPYQGETMYSYSCDVFNFIVSIVCSVQCKQRWDFCFVNGTQSIVKSYFTVNGFKFGRNFCCCIFLGSGMTIPYWDFTGSTIVTNNYIRLTSDDQSLSGSIWNQVVSPSLVRTSRIRSRWKWYRPFLCFLKTKFFLAGNVPKLGDPY